MMVIDKNFQFGITWEVIHKAGTQDFFYGPIFVLIDGRVCPLYTRYDHTIDVVFRSMQQSFITQHWSDGSNGKDLGNKHVSCRQIDYDTVQNILNIGMADLEIARDRDVLMNLIMRIGYNGDEERLFYTLDLFKTFTEVRFPRGTVEKVIMSLPNRPEEFARQLKDSPVRIV
jgi:hypothetical protein